MGLSEHCTGDIENKSNEMKTLKTSANVSDFRDLARGRSPQFRVGSSRVLRVLTAAIPGYGCGGNYREITAIASERRSYTSEDIDIQLGTRRCNFPRLSPSRHFLDDFPCLTDLFNRSTVRIADN